MALMKQTARKGNKGLPKATKGRKGRGSGSGHGCGSAGGSGGNGNGNGDETGNIPGGHFMQQFEHRPSPAALKQRKPYVRAFREMKKLQWTTKLCISKYQMAR